MPCICVLQSMHFSSIQIVVVWRHLAPSCEAGWISNLHTSSLVLWVTIYSTSTTFRSPKAVLLNPRALTFLPVDGPPVYTEFISSRCLYLFHNKSLQIYGAMETDPPAWKRKECDTVGNHVAAERVPPEKRLNGISTLQSFWLEQSRFLKRHNNQKNLWIDPRQHKC